MRRKICPKCNKKRPENHFRLPMTLEEMRARGVENAPAGYRARISIACCVRCHPLGLARAVRDRSIPGIQAAVLRGLCTPGRAAVLIDKIQAHRAHARAVWANKVRTAGWRWLADTLATANWRWRRQAKFDPYPEARAFAAEHCSLLELAIARCRAAADKGSPYKDLPSWTLLVSIERLNALYRALDNVPLDARERWMHKPLLVMAPPSMPVELRLKRLYAPGSKPRRPGPDFTVDE